MKPIKRSIYTLSLLAAAVFLLSWGMYGHNHINRSAVFALPPEMRSFFYNHIDFITEESTIPDLRKYTLNDKSENQRHFIDIGDSATMNIDSLPRTMKEAKAVYNEKMFQRIGMLPWYIQEMMEKLTKAFKEKRRTEILFIAADLGHYIGDANMPLHTSINHNGQLTGQKGIHSFFEAQLPEYFGYLYNYKVNEAVYLPDITSATWDIIKHSNSLVDNLLATDKNTKASFSYKGLYKTGANGDTLKNKFGQPVFSDAYAAAYHAALNGMVENQIRHASQDLANFWYTAWVNAGKPDLNDLDPEELTKANRKRYKKEFEAFQKGKLMGFKSEREY